MNIESSQDILDLSGSSNEESIGPSPLISSISQSKLTSPAIARNPSESSSITPSPVIMSLSTALQRNTTESCQCHHHVDSLLSKFDQLNISDRNEFFGRLIIKCEKSDLENLSEEIVNHLSRLLGELCRDKIKEEADRFRFKRSRDDEDSLSSEILSKKLKIEQLHIFFEAATGKSGRMDSKNQEKVATYQATFYESLLKGANLHTVGPCSMMKASQLKLKTHSKHVFENHLGGSFQFHHLRTFWDYLGLSRTIWDYIGLYQTIWDYMGLSGTMRDYLGLSRTILVYLRLSWTISDYLGLCQTVGLS